VRQRHALGRPGGSRRVEQDRAILGTDAREGDLSAVVRRVVLGQRQRAHAPLLERPAQPQRRGLRDQCDARPAVAQHVAEALGAERRVHRYHAGAAMQDGEAGHDPVGAARPAEDDRIARPDTRMDETARPALDLGGEIAVADQPHPIRLEGDDRVAPPALREVMHRGLQCRRQRAEPKVGYHAVPYVIRRRRAAPPRTAACETARSRRQGHRIRSRLGDEETPRKPCAPRPLTLVRLRRASASPIGWD